jgi:hypothetical protein
MTDEELNRRFEGLAELIHDVADGLDKRMDALGERLAIMERHLDRMDTRLGALEFELYRRMQGGKA